MARSLLSFNIALVVAIAGFGTSSAWAQTAPSTTGSANQKYPGVAEAVQKLLRGDVAGSFQDLTKESKAHPELPSQYVLMYNFLSQLKQPAAARGMLEQAVTATKSDPEPWIILGEIALNDNRVAEAELDFAYAKPLVAAYKGDADRLKNLQAAELSGLARVTELRGKWTDAQYWLTEYLKLIPEDLMGQQRLAKALFLQGPEKQAAAFEVLKKAKEIDKAKNTPQQMLPAEAVMARFHDEADRDPAGWKKPSANAKEWYTKALEAASKDLNLRREVGVWALSNGEIALAKKQADAAIDIEKNDPKLAGSIIGRMLSGYVAMWEKRWKDAEGYFRSILLEDPSNFAARNNIALALVEQGDPKDPNNSKPELAEKYATDNYQANKENADAVSTLIWVYYKRGNFQAATQTGELLLKGTGQNIPNADTGFYLAQVAYHNDQKYAAKQILERIKNAPPFSMKQEADALYAKVKDEQPPAQPGTAGSPTTSTSAAPKK